MGLPFWEMPDGLVIGGRRYPIDSDFRVGLRVRQMFWEPYYQVRQGQLLEGIRRLLFLDAAPAVGLETPMLCAVLWYLLDGRMTQERILRRLCGEGVPGIAVPDAADAVFSYLWDMPALYAAFLEAYQMDLLTVKLHLWQFDALFAALPEECMLSRTMALRAAPTDSAEDGEARAALAAQKLAVRIPDADTLHRLYLDQTGDVVCCSFAKQGKTGDKTRAAGQEDRISVTECGDENGGFPPMTLLDMMKNNEQEELRYAECRWAGFDPCGDGHGGCDARDCRDENRAE